MEHTTRVGGQIVSIWVFKRPKQRTASSSAPEKRGSQVLVIAADLLRSGLMPNDVNERGAFPWRCRTPTFSRSFSLTANVQED